MNPTQEEFEQLKIDFQNLQTLFLQHVHTGFDQSAKLPTKVITLKDQATILTKAAFGTFFSVTLAGNRTLARPTNMQDGQTLIFEIIQDGTGSRTLTLDSVFSFGATITSITLSTTANKRDFIGCKYRASEDKLYIVAFQDGY